jgi:hypothetical protein
VLKFRGAGQGSKALIAELLGGEIMRAAGMKVPEIVFANLDESFGRTEPDEEIQDLLRNSEGINLGLHYLSGAITYDPAADHVSDALAARIVWLDSLLTNVDRTPRNTNMLTWRGDLWLIDHGAALYFHHSWQNWEEQSIKPFVQIRDHVFLARAITGIREADEEMKRLLTRDRIAAIVSVIPGAWLSGHGHREDAEEMKRIYEQFLVNRINHSDIFVNEIIHAGESFL